MSLSPTPADPGAFHRPPRSFPPAMPEEPVVIACPPTKSGRFSGGLMSMLLPALGSLGMVAFAFVIPSRIFLIISGVFVAVSLFSVVAQYWSQRRSGKKSARTTRRLYRAHLAERDARLAALAVRQREIDERLYPDPVRLVPSTARREHLWERRARDRDFLTFRLGSAAVPLDCEVTLDLSEDPLTEYEPDLLAEAEAVLARHRAVAGLSVVASLADAEVVTVVGDRTGSVALVGALLGQAAAFRAPSDLRILVAFPAQRRAGWEWVKWLPHARSGRVTQAAAPSLLLASGIEELERLLEDHVQPRVEQLRRIESSNTADAKRASVDAPEMLLVLDGFSAGGPVARLPLIRELAAHGTRLKVHTICLVGEGDAEPSEAALRILVSEDGPITLERTGPSGHTIAGIAGDVLSPSAAEGLARALAPLRLEESAAAIDLANDVRLVDLRSETAGTLRAPIGVADDGDELVLDLKQAADGGMGPHGLIVGATGSGKSELLRTIVASLAASHTPDQLCFVFVDFKGGAAFADLAGLPHAAGMITNLQHDLTLVDRMHDALFGEQQRRQSLLRAAGNVDDVTAYAALRARRPELEPLPHLLLIVDEFGELLANRPEFIDLFLTIGRVGRSLGMHLLLSSQRLEEGRLKGLEGHLRYRIGLRTYSAAESRAVLDNPDAYLLPPFPGVAFLKVDTDVYRRFKTALVTSPHVDRDAAGRLVVSSFHAGAAVIPGTAQPPSAVAPADTDHGATDLDVLVAAARDRYAGDGAVHQVWLAPLPAHVSSESVECGDPWWRRGDAEWSGPSVTLGLLDLPSQQRQEPLVVDLGGVGGHLAVVGAPLTGKSNLLRTALVSLITRATPDEVRVYALDFGGGLLRALEDAPHVGGVSGRSDHESVNATVRQVHGLLAERELIFREHGVDSIADARRLREQGVLSADATADVFLAVDNWGGVLSEHEDLAEALAEIAASGLSRGIHLLISAPRWADIRPAVREAFASRVELRLNDPMDSDFGRRIAQIVPQHIPGRGVTPDGRLFQVALPADRIDGVGEAVSAVARDLRRRWHGPVAPAVRTLPPLIDAAALAGDDGPGIPIGVQELTLDVARVDLAGSDGHMLILGEAESGRTTALRLIAATLAADRGGPSAELVVIDFRRGLADVSDLEIPCRHVSRMGQLEEAMTALREEAVARLGSLDEAGDMGDGPKPREIYVLVDDYDLIAGLGHNPLSALGDIVVQARDAGIHVVIARASSGMARAAMDPVLSRVIESGAPVLILSGDRHEGPLVRGVRAESMPPGRGRLLRRRGQPVVVQLAHPPARTGGPVARP